MTVSYSLDIASVNFTTVFKLMTRWKGSVVKVLLKEGSVYFGLYLIVSLVYRFGLNSEQKMLFEAIARYCERYRGMVPTTFILGFYVSIVFTRWNHILNNIPWPDTAVIFTSTYLHGDAKSLLYRRAISRYLIGAIVLSLRTISIQVMKRFPTIDHVVDSGLLTPSEAVMLDRLDSAAGDAKHWALIQWAVNLVTRARKEGRIDSDVYANSASEKINDVRKNLGEMLVADSICIPLVYTQIVTLAVWTHFVASLFTSQIWVTTQGLEAESGPLELDIYVPVFTILQFICLVGWLRVAQDMLNPLGEADDDFELNAIIDRNLKVGFLIMDENAGIVPLLDVDLFMDAVEPTLPHTAASAAAADKGSGMVPSVAGVKIPAKAQKVVESSRLSSGRSSVQNVSTAHRLASRATNRSGGDIERVSHKGSGSTRPPSSSKAQATSAALQLKLEQIEGQVVWTDIGDGTLNPSHREFSAKPRVGTVVEEDEEGSPAPEDVVVAAETAPLAKAAPAMPAPQTPPVKRSDLLERKIRKENERESVRNVSTSSGPDKDMEIRYAVRTVSTGSGSDVGFDRGQIYYDGQC